MIRPEVRIILNNNNPANFTKSKHDSYIGTAFRYKNLNLYVNRDGLLTKKGIWIFSMFWVVSITSEEKQALRVVWNDLEKYFEKKEHETKVVKSSGLLKKIIK
jgi:hypothetical protein